MDGPLWTEQYPPDLADVPQPSARDALAGVREEPMHVLIHGPAGSGKTAAVRALARELHANPDADLVEINVADVFGMTKAEIRDDPRFAHFLEGETEFSKQYRSGGADNQYKREWSKREMLAHVLKELAGYPPTDGDFKTVLLDNAEAMREDFQQALRRVIERHHESTQFVIATRQPSKLIAPIRSRCFPVVMRAPTHEETIGALERVADAAGADYDEDGLAFVAGYADGDLREAVLAAQTTAVQYDEITRETAYEAIQNVEADEQVADMVDAAAAGEFTDARSVLDDLLVDEGMDGSDVLEDVLDEVRSRWTGERVARVHRIAGEVDLAMETGTSDRIQIGNLLAQLPETEA